MEAAAAAQSAKGNTLTGPTERSVELAERLVRRGRASRQADFDTHPATPNHQVGLRPGTSWAILGKNGTDATLAARAAARAATGRFARPPPAPAPQAG